MDRLTAWVASAEARMAAVEQKMATSRLKDRRGARRRMNTAFDGGRGRQQPTSPPALGPIAPHLPPL